MSGSQSRLREGGARTDQDRRVVLHSGAYAIRNGDFFGGVFDGAADSTTPWQCFAAESRAPHVDDFPGRWSRRREIAPEYAPLPAVVAAALETAGWWQRGSGAAVDGGLIVLNDGFSEAAARRFACVASSDDIPRPSEFLHTLPSTGCSILGLLFGLTSYQTTVVGGAIAAFHALQHASDLLLLRRLDRLVVAVFSSPLHGRRRESSLADGLDVDRAAAAFCLSRGDATHHVECRVGVDSMQNVEDRMEARQASKMLAHDQLWKHAGGGVFPFVSVAKWMERWSRGAESLPFRLEVAADDAPGSSGWLLVEERTTRDAC